jgi:hypothetical protein
VYYNLVLSHVNFHIYILVLENIPVQSVIFIYTCLYLKFKFRTMYYMLLHLYFETADFVLELPTYFSSNGIIRSAEL